MSVFVFRDSPSPAADAVPPRESDSTPDLDQLPLFSWEELHPEDDEDDLPKRVTRPRTYDGAVLRYAGWHRWVTKLQVVHRFFVYAGKGPAYGYRLVNRLLDRGWLCEERLRPDRGNASQEVLTLSDDGWLYCGHSPPDTRERDRWAKLRDYFLQFAEVLLERQARGWRFVPRDAVHEETGGNLPFELLREWALDSFRDGSLAPWNRDLRESIRRGPEFSLDLDLLWRPTSNEVRLLLPVRRGLSFKRKMEGLPVRHLKGFPTLHFEFVCPRMELLESARKVVQRWGRSHRQDIRIHRVPHFLTRSYPSEPASELSNLYRKHGVPDPRNLL